MKIRTGFISNSSSSSFIVAFSQKPKTKGDVMNEMFSNDPNGSISSPWSHVERGLSHSQIVEQVLSDLKSKSKKVSKTELMDELSGRYFVMDGKLYYEGAAYYALDKKLAQKYVDVYNEYEEARKQFDTIERELIHKHVGPNVPYAFKNSIDWKTKQPCTKEDIEAYETYTAVVKKFGETNKEYISARKKHNRETHKYWKTQRILAQKLARIDLAKFLEDNKKKFITRFTYSDNDGQFFSLMEHSDVFHNLNHIHISHH